MLWSKVLRPPLAAVVGWVSDNALAVAGAVMAVLSGGHLYGLVRASVPASTGVDATTLLAVGAANPAYVLATLTGCAVFLAWRA